MIYLLILVIGVLIGAVAMHVLQIGAEERAAERDREFWDTYKMPAADPLDANAVPECEHEWTEHSDGFGDPEVVNGTGTIVWRQCDHCGKREFS